MGLDGSRENRLGPSSRPQGSTQSFQAINELVSGLDQRAPIVSIAAMTYLTGEVLVSRRAVTSGALDGLWRAASSRDVDVAGAALATILLLKNDDPQQRQKIFSVLAEAPKRREALRLRMVFNLIGADHALTHDLHR